MEPTSSTTPGAPLVDAQTTSSPEQAPAAVTSVEQLVHLAFDPSGKPGPTPQDLRSIVGDLSEETLEDERTLVRSLSRGDTFLQGPWRLLVALARSPLSATSPLGRRVLGLAVEALVASPVFAGLASRLNAPSDDKPLTALHVKTAVNDVRAEDLGLEPRGLTQRDRDKLRTTAVSCFLLYGVLRHGWTVDRVIDEVIEAKVWRGDTKTSPGSAAAALLSARGAANGILVDYLATRRNEADEAVREARTSAEQQAHRAARAEQVERDLRIDVDREEATSAALRARISELEAEVSVERVNRVADTSTHTDDYEQLRTRTLRNLTAQVELLSDGLAALREGVHDVADEYMDRALGAIQKETDRLSELGKAGR